jgi:hypothetical protein
MYIQEKLDFEVHTRESNPESESFLKVNVKQISRNCQKLFDAFMAGAVINTYNSPVPEFRRRRQDLTDNNGVKISGCEKVKIGDSILKNWKMTSEDIEYNKKFYGKRN